MLAVDVSRDAIAALIAMVCAFAWNLLDPEILVLGLPVETGRLRRLTMIIARRCRDKWTSVWRSAAVWSLETTAHVRADRIGDCALVVTVSWLSIFRMIVHVW